MPYMYCSAGILTTKFISNTFINAVETVNTLQKLLLLAFILKRRQSYLFLFWFADRKSFFLLVRL